MAEDDSVSLALELTGSDLDLRTVGAVAHKLETLLSQLEAGITGDKPHAMWRVEDEAVLRAVASVNSVSHQTLVQVSQTFHDALESADVGLPLPAVVNRQAARTVREILGYLKQIDTMTLFAGDAEPLHLHRRDKILGVEAPPTYAEVSSLDGVLDLISVRRGAHFGIEEHGTKRKVRCYFDGDLLEEVKDALGKRVVVEGTVRFRRDGTPTSIHVTSLFRRPIAESVRKLKGSMPGFTGDLSAEEHVRQLRTADGED